MADQRGGADGRQAGLGSGSSRTESPGASPEVQARRSVPQPPVRFRPVDRREAARRALRRQPVDGPDPPARPPAARSRAPGPDRDVQSTIRQPDPLTSVVDAPIPLVARRRAQPPPRQPQPGSPGLARRSPPEVVVQGSGNPYASTAAVERPARRGVRIRLQGPQPPAGPEPYEPKKGFRARYAVVYDVTGPRVRLGVGWALLVGGALGFRPTRLAAVAVLYAIAAAWAAYQLLMAGRRHRPGGNLWVAAGGAAALPVASAAFGARGAGVVLLGMVAISLAAESVDADRREAVAAAAGRVVSCGAWVGLAGAGVVLTLRYEIGAVITLLVLVAVYEASDYIVGSGGSNPVEGPLAGVISIAVVTAIVAFLRVPPFRGTDAFAFGGLAAVACPAGQLVASALLPDPAAPAPALRRLDSLLILAPLWAWFVGLLLTRGT